MLLDRNGCKTQKYFNSEPRYKYEFLKTCLFFLLIRNDEPSEHLTLLPVLVTGTDGFIYGIINHYIKLPLQQIFSWESLGGLV